MDPSSGKKRMSSKYASPEVTFRAILMLVALDGMEMMESIFCQPSIIFPDGIRLNVLEAPEKEILKYGFVY